MKILVMTIMVLWLTGCAGAPVVPPELKEKVDRSVTFQQVKASPPAYKGRFIVVGGVVLSAKPLKQGGTRIEILQLPLDGDDEPLSRLTESKGRFLAQHKEFLDPATIPFGTRVTVVGEVTGSMTLQVDEIDYEYPTLDIASLTVWPPKLPAYWFRPYPYFGAFWGSYWGPYWGPPQWVPWPAEKR
jgi:outer membrane lipoprotein